MHRKPRFTLVMMSILLMFGMVGIQPVEPVQAALASDLFFSEYIEGTNDSSGINRAIEIYNGTGASVDLSNYRLELYSNGASSPGANTLDLSGTLASGDVFVVAHPLAASVFLAQADLTDSAVINFDGNDAFALRKISTGLFVDVIGQIGVNPGTYWGSSVRTQDRTLVRKADICSGDTDGSDTFDPVTEWDSHVSNTYNYIGSHTSNCVLSEAEALLWLQENTTLTGTLDALVATFPDEIPAVIVDEDYVIDSRMTLAEALPAGTTVTIYREGVAVPGLTGITLSGTGPFYFTELFDPDAPRAAFDGGYGGAVENYVIEVTGPGTNPLDFETTVFIESVISKDGFTTETVLDDITLGVLIPADESAALAWLQANTVLSSASGTIADLKATFPASIPPVIVAEDYVIDSRISLSEALPEGVTVNVYREGTLILEDLVLEGIGPFWFTQLFDPDAQRAAFDAGYGSAIENYSFILNGAVAFDYSATVTIESVISKDDFTTETVLDDIDLAASIAATEAEALAYVIENTILSSVSGTIADLKATFPDHIPPIISDGLYVIDSRFTLAEALPSGTTVTVFKNGVEILTDITLSGTGPFWFTTLFDPDQPRANFDEAIYVLRIGTSVLISNNPQVEPGLDEIVLDEITLDVHIDDGVAPVMEDVLPAEGALLFGPDDTLVLTVDAADLNLYELEIDHILESDPTLPEFSVYASETDPYGGDGALFASAGVTVDYDATEQVWTIDFGDVITDKFITNGGITFYMVLKDLAGNTWGSMSPTTDANTYIYTIELDEVARIGGRRCYLTVDADLTCMNWRSTTFWNWSSVCTQARLILMVGMALCLHQQVTVDYDATEQVWTIDFEM